ncbi:MAG: lysophospholipid acyltransferase family protein [Desulfobacteraceae bacterium]|jgi:1-acyl-sn-glycerol-3-phosphate acyltransferase
MNTRFGLSDNYRTVPEKVPFVSRLLPELSFYNRFLWTVFKAAAKAGYNRYDKEALYHSSFDVLRDLERIGVSFEIDGTGYLQQFEGPCVIVANHMSVLETAILPVIILPIKDLTFIVKEGLMRYPVFKHVLATLDPIVVGRVNPRQDLRTVMQEGVDRLNHGTSVVVFPQTTRSNAFDTRRFNSLGIKLAHRAKVPAVPLALATDAWGSGRIIKDFGKIDTLKTVRFSFGRPITIQDRGGQAHQAVIKFIKGQLSQWHYITSTPAAE